VSAFGADWLKNPRAVMTRWRANVAIAAWLFLFVLTMLTTRVPYVAPLSFVIVVLITWDYGLRPALAWVAVVHVVIPTLLFLLEVGPFFVFVEARDVVLMIMIATLLTVIGLAILTDRVRSLTQRLRHSQSALAHANEQLHAALAEVKELRGLVPVCASCKDIRDHRGDWQAMEAYISRHSRATFTHGLCPKCLKGQLQT
jgi:hypothetical protein